MDIQQLLINHPDLWSYFQKLSPSHQKAYIDWLTSAKKEATQKKRQNDFINLLKDKISS